MGFLSTFTGSAGAKAAKGAAEVQAQATKEARGDVRKAERIGRMDLRDFREVGRDAIPGLTNLVTDPTAQRDYVQQNPFFQSLADESQRRLLNNSAARGKVGSGGTAEALQNSIMLLGNDLVAQNIQQRQGLVKTGLAAAGGMANISQNAGMTIADLRTQGGNAAASGIMGAAAARSQGVSNIMELGKTVGAAMMMSDRRLKRDIAQIGALPSGLPLYSFRYVWGGPPQVGVMAQEAASIFPGAVHSVGGYLCVDYGAIY